MAIDVDAIEHDRPWKATSDKSTNAIRAIRVIRPKSAFLICVLLALDLNLGLGSNLDRYFLNLEVRGFDAV